MSMSIEEKIAAVCAPHASESEPLPRYIVAGDVVKGDGGLCFGDLVERTAYPELKGMNYAAPGEETTLYYPLRRYSDRVQLLIEMGAIIPVGGE
jgi:hypothetical protein